MAEPIKRGDKYRHSVMINKTRHYGSFDTKKLARDWESNLRFLANNNPNSPELSKRHKLSDACDKYLATVTPAKRDAMKWETARFNEFVETFQGCYMDEITSEKIGNWRDTLLKRVSGSTVNRYFNLFSNLFTVAKREWKWVESNPFSDVRRPTDNPAREVVWGWRQIREILREGQRRGGKYHEVTQAFHISLRTAMRLQEALASPNGFNANTATVRIVKRKEDPRPISIPLTRHGKRLMKRAKPFTVSPNMASTLFCNLKRELGIEGLEYKDSRATALTSMARVMDVKTLKRISRHKDINILINTYYRETAEQISSRLG